jgi:hypothetical protein
LLNAKHDRRDIKLGFFGAWVIETKLSEGTTIAAASAVYGNDAIAGFKLFAKSL